MRVFFFLFLLMNSFGTFSQENNPENDTINNDTINNKTDSLKVELAEKKYFIVEGDSIPVEFIGLEEVVLLSDLTFENELERRKYLILRRKTIKVYPYAKLAAERLLELNRRLEQIESGSARRKYIKIVQEYIEDEFSAELKKLTRTEGQILVKLIHRQTGITTYELIRELRSGWRAFWYNATASLFDISLKEEFHPESVKEDFWIEDILQRAFRADMLEEQPSVLDFNFLELTNRWNDISEAQD